MTIDCKWAALVGKLNTYARAMPGPKSSIEDMVMDQVYILGKQVSTSRFTGV